RTSPLILAIDDLHLADDESLDILERLPAELGEASVVVLMTARHELLARRPDWGRGPGNAPRVELSPLSRPDLEGMIRAVLGVSPSEVLPPALIDHAVAESGGNPYVVEQMLHLYHRHGVLVPDGGPERGGWWFDPRKAAVERVALSPEQAGRGRIASLSAAEAAVLA